MLRLILGLLLCVSLVLPGCKKKTQDQPTAAVPSGRAAVKLTVLVVDDPNLAAGINLLRGEWAERSGGELEVKEWPIQELLEAEKLSCDVVIFPSRYLGTLVESQSLRQVRKSLLQDEQFNFQDILPLVRDRAMRYGGKIFGLSLGEPPLMLAWEGDLPPKMAPSSPINWNQCLRRPQAATLKNTLAAELIVRAVVYSDLRGDSAVLFDPQTMEPRLLEPPFVRALQGLVASKQEVDRRDDMPTVEPSWPTAGPETAQSKPPSMLSFTAIPRADEVYDRSLDAWSSGEEIGGAPTFLGFSGRMAGVSQTSRNAVSAFKLLKWLASGETATQLSQRSSATIWFRQSQIAQSSKWLRRRKVSEATSAAVTKLLSSDNAYLLPRIPGFDEYLLSLDKVVADAVSGTFDEEKALREAAARWQAITQSYGKQHQRQAYRRHLGLDDFSE